jgi:hypothetical protein
MGRLFAMGVALSMAFTAPAFAQYLGANSQGAAQYGQPNSLNARAQAPNSNQDQQGGVLFPGIDTTTLLIGGVVVIGGGALIAVAVSNSSSNNSPVSP